VLTGAATITGHTGSFNVGTRVERVGGGIIPGRFRANVVKGSCELEVRVETTVDVDLHQGSKV